MQHIFQGEEDGLWSEAGEIGQIPTGPSVVDRRDGGVGSTGRHVCGVLSDRSATAGETWWQHPHRASGGPGTPQRIIDDDFSDIDVALATVTVALGRARGVLGGTPPGRLRGAPPEAHQTVDQPGPHQGRAEDRRPELQPAGLLRGPPRGSPPRGRARWQDGDRQVQDSQLRSMA